MPLLWVSNGGVIAGMVGVETCGVYRPLIPLLRLAGTEVVLFGRDWTALGADLIADALVSNSFCESAEMA